MGSKVSKGVAETYANDDSSTTYVWNLKNGEWWRYLSSDRYWNWFRDECNVESPPFILADPYNSKFRLGLKDPPGLTSIVAYAKFSRPLPASIDPKWEVLIGDSSNCISVSHRPRISFSRSNGKVFRYFLVIELDHDPPIYESLSIRLALSTNKPTDGITKNNSLISIPSLASGRNIWRANLGRLLSTSSEKEDVDEEGSGDYHFDVTLIVEDVHVFYAHRSVLACHSPVFWAMFRNGNSFKENQQREVVIEDIAVDVMAYLLQYLYTGDVQSGDLADGSIGSESGEIPFRELLACSEKYDVKGLKHICESKLATQLTPENVCELLALADMFRASSLKAACMRYMNGRGARIGKSEAFRKLARQSSALFKDVCSKLW